MALPKYHFNSALRPGEHIAIGDGKEWLQLDADMCAFVSADNAQLLKDTGWDLEPYDPIRHAHPFTELPPTPKSAAEVIELVEFCDPKARLAFERALRLEAERRLEPQETSQSATIQEHDDWISARRTAAALFGRLFGRGD